VRRHHNTGARGLGRRHRGHSGLPLPLGRRPHDVGAAAVGGGQPAAAVAAAVLGGAGHFATAGGGDDERDGGGCGAAVRRAEENTAGSRVRIVWLMRKYPFMYSGDGKNREYF